MWQSGGSGSVYVCFMYDVKRFVTVVEFKGGHFSSRALVIRGK
jgi:hypothetical protein